MKKRVNVLLLVAVVVSLLLSTKASAAYEFVEGGTSMAMAQSIDVNQEYAATLPGGEGKVLYFKFTTPAEKGFFTFYVKNLTIKTHSWSGDVQVQFQLIDAASEELCLMRKGYNTEETKALVLEPSTTYFIKVWNKSPNEEAGNFKLNVGYKEDKEGDTKESAVQVMLDQKVEGTLDGATDVDFYQFTTGQWKEYIISSQNVNINTHSWSSDVMFYTNIQSGIDEVLARVRLTYGKTGESRVTLEPNTTYFVKVADPHKALGQYTFTVSPVRIDINQTQTIYKTQYTYNGKAIKPAVEVTYEGKTLVEGTDYSVSYPESNIKPGNGRIVVKGEGDYTGEVTLTFKISPKKTTLTAKNNAKGKLAVTIKKSSGASGYEISYATSKKNVKKVKTTSLKKTLSVTKGKTYSVRVRSYKKVGEIYIYSGWSDSYKVKIKK